MSNLIVKDLDYLEMAEENVLGGFGFGSAFGYAGAIGGSFNTALTFASSFATPFYGVSASGSLSASS